MGWTIGVLGFDSRRRLGIFFFTTLSRTALGPTQPPIQWVPGALSLGLKLPEREADHSPPSSAEVKERVELYLHSPNTPSWRGAQLKKALNKIHKNLCGWWLITNCDTYDSFGKIMKQCDSIYVMFQVEVFRVVTGRSDVVGHHLILMKYAAWSSETFVSYRINTGS
jgi:hypothetical protein